MARHLAGAVTLMVASAWPALAMAQVAAPVDAAATDGAVDGAADGFQGDIVVTARLREETLTSAPVAVSAVGAAEIQRRAIVSVDNLVQSVPQLIISDAGSSAQGGIVVIRGIGVGESNGFADQAVSFNIDGVQVGRANIRRSAEVDMVQVEVLKGPQALFFGKNSPGGIIAIRTADPGDRFEAGAMTSYEFVGDELRTEGFLSGPLSDTLGARVAVYASRLDGYFRNVTLASPLYGPSRDRLPFGRDYGGRLTLKYDGGAFDARVKLNYSQFDGASVSGNMQATACPLGFNQLAPSDPCRLDNEIVNARPGPAIAAFSPEFRATPESHQAQFLGSLEMNYALSDTLKLTAITGYYDSKLRYFDQFSIADATHPTVIYAGRQRLTIKELSQELRLQSDFDGMFNFLLGGYYQHSSLYFYNFAVRNAVAPALLVPKTPASQRGDAFSGFGQAIVNITPQIELSGGGRYSHELKRFSVVNATTGVPIVTRVPRRTWSNFSPEATLAWRPDEYLTIYGAYKTGFLSGGFNVGSGNLAGNRAYDQQTTKGFEAGVKARSADGVLRGSLIAYTYDTRGLQVNSNIPNTSGGFDQVVQNAGRAYTRGVELEGSFRPVRELTLNASVGYNRGRYQDFLSNCYGGQTIALGCRFNPNATGAFSQQQLAGAQLLRAPEWTVQGGVAYDLPIADRQVLQVSGDVAYSDGFFTNATNKPISYQKSFATVDATIQYRDERTGMTFGLVGRNLTNKYYVYRTIDSLFTGSGTGLATGTPSDSYGAVNRGRQIMLRAGFRLP